MFMEAEIVTKRGKRLAKVRRNPKNVRKEDLAEVLSDFGFTPDFTAGSHVTYRHPSGARITVVAHGPHVPAYIVRQALHAIDSLKGTDENALSDEDEPDAQDEQDA